MPPKQKSSSDATGPRLVTKSTRPQPVSTPLFPQEEIAKRAYELFMQDGGVHGRDVEHWLRAEQDALALSRATTKVAGARATT